MSSRKSSQMEALDAYIKSLPLADNPTRKRGFLIQTLHKAQSLFGYLPVEVQSFVAERLGISLAEVYGVISFYSFFTDTWRRFRQSTGSSASASRARIRRAARTS